MSATTEIKNFADDPIFQVLGNTKMEPVKEEPITKELATKYSKFMANYNGSQGIPPEFRALSEKPGGNYGSIIFKKCVVYFFAFLFSKISCVFRHYFKWIEYIKSQNLYKRYY
jgi:hypothetical protein